MNSNVKEGYITGTKATKILPYSCSTIRLYANQGKIRTIKSAGGKRYYSVEDLEQLSGSSIKDKSEYIYTRVSSRKQKEDLARQTELLKKEFPSASVISDISSGLNFNRRGLQHLLKEISRGNVSKVIVTYKDRLCRFGIEMFEWIFKENNITFIVYSKNFTEFSCMEELSRDILDINNFFIAKYNGAKSAKYRRLRKAIKINESEDKREDSDGRNSDESNEDTVNTLQ